MYIYNLVYNIIYIIKYILSNYITEKEINNKNGKYALIMLMIQLLKFNIKILYDGTKIYHVKNQSKNIKTDIDLIVLYKNKLVYFECKYITKNTNNNNYYDLSTQINTQKKCIGQPNGIYILYIYGEKLSAITENIIKNEISDIYIYYNKINQLPNHNTHFDNKIMMFTQSILGAICSYYNTDDIFNKIMNKFNQYHLCVYENYYNSFDKRMNDSYILIERNRWNQIKNKFTIIYNSDFSNSSVNSIQCLLDSFYQIRKKKKNYNYIKYIWINNFKCITIKDEMCRYDNIFDTTEIYCMPIYGAGDDNEYKKNNYILRKLKLYAYYIYIYYFIYFVKL